MILIVLLNFNHFLLIASSRASKLLNELRWEEFKNLKNGREFPDFRAGDSIQVERLPYSTSTEVDILKGVVIARTNRASESLVTMANVSF